MKRTWAAVAACVVVVAIGMIVASHQQSVAEHRNPCFKYGQPVLEAIYGGDLGDPVRTACNNALDAPPPNLRPPVNLDRSKAVAG